MLFPALVKFSGLENTNLIAVLVLKSQLNLTLPKLYLTDLTYLKSMS